MAPCLVAMPSNGHPPPPFAFNTPMLTATNAPLNIPRPQPAPKSRRMRPTKSITPRYVHIFPCQRPVLLFIYSGISVLLIGVRSTRAHRMTLITFGILCLRTKKMYVMLISKLFCYSKILKFDLSFRVTKPFRKSALSRTRNLLNLETRLFCHGNWTSTSTSLLANVTVIANNWLGIYSICAFGLNFVQYILIQFIIIKIATN